MRIREALPLVRRTLQLGPVGATRIITVATAAALLDRRLRRRSLPVVAAKMGVRLTGPVPIACGPLRLSQRESEAVRDIRRILIHGPFNGTCLRQALLLGRALRRHETLLQLGVRKDRGDVRAHAWLVVDGHCIDDYRILGTQPADFVLMPIDHHSIGER